MKNLYILEIYVCLELHQLFVKTYSFWLCNLSKIVVRVTTQALDISSDSIIKQKRIKTQYWKSVKTTWFCNTIFVDLQYLEFEGRPRKKYFIN